MATSAVGLFQNVYDARRAAARLIEDGFRPRQVAVVSHDGDATDPSHKRRVFPLPDRDQVLNGIISAFFPATLAGLGIGILAQQFHLLFGGSPLLPFLGVLMGAVLAVLLGGLGGVLAGTGLEGHPLTSYRDEIAHGSAMVVVSVLRVRSAHRAAEVLARSGALNSTIEGTTGRVVVEDTPSNRLARRDGWRNVYV